MLKLTQTFDIKKDVISSISAIEETVRSQGCGGVADTRILNVERDGGVVYHWRGATGTTRIGKYDPHTKQNKLLFTFDKQVCICSCSLNKEETLLAVSLIQSTQGGEERFKPVSKFLTLLIEIHPFNNTRVLKAVDCRVKVQFLYPHSSRSAVLESHLLLAAEDGYVDQFHIPLVKQEGYRVVVRSPEHLARDRVVDEACWLQWDSGPQRLFYLSGREKYLLKCVQFFPDRNFETVFELSLELPSNSFTSVRFVNFGHDHFQEQEDQGLKLVVFTDRTGTMCVCYSHPLNGYKDSAYTIAFVHRGFSKTFTVALTHTATPADALSLRTVFIHLGYYIVVYLAGHFLHLINCRQQDLLCHSLFLSGADAHVDGLGAGRVVASTWDRRVLDWQAGRMYDGDLSHAFLLKLLSPARPQAQRLAALHCMLVHLGPDPDLEQKIIEWISDSVMSFDAFDQIQEFILASLYRICYQQSLSLDTVLPYSSVFEKKELPVALTAIPGVKCTPELLAQPIIKGKARNLQGYWEELQWIIERMRYFEAVPNPRYRTSQMRSDWTQLQAALNSEKKRSCNDLRNLEENTKKVLSMVDTWRLDKRVVPLFQEEDLPQRMLVGLMVDKLREHLNRHLPRLGKKKIDMLALNYVAKLLELVRHMLESVWLKLNLGPSVVCLKEQGSPKDWLMFHVMCRILEATQGLCLPLPPGYSTLLTVLGMRCLPRHTFLQYVDHGFLKLTEPFVSRLMTDLDNSDGNEELKFSVLKRLPECLKQRVWQLWDHPVSSACISREYVRALLEKYTKSTGSVQLDKDKTCFRPEFLPLAYLASVLSDMEKHAPDPFQEQENVDARFVEETALKQTLIKLGLEDK
ncbi:gamma-secretase-activating protein isoform X2 [Electrophorus electricus]|uniref:gamma-secretase-activating protein isoform X2 n=1 Tax=Electrophorus electricus TaxID=8005 RepID=UPI0015CF9857|nr:gamma-secretase-activating protein isoform X2 [Electrophorus electricus]